MSYVVLARKWRPMTFADLVGQEHVAKTLGNAIALDRVAHAFLFTGVRGVGKTTSARILAKALNCEKGPTVTPCLTCAACTEIAAGNDMDVMEIDAASRTGVDDIRELQETLAYRPSRDRFKVYIVDEVHMLSTNAWNAFLKTLEEPPPHVKFIFATTEVNKVPVTILSRCQRYDFKLIDVATVAARLTYVLEQEGLSAEPGAIQILAREAAGSMRDAMSLLDQVIAWSGGESITTAAVARALGVAEAGALLALVRALVAGDAARCLTLANDLFDTGHDVAHLSKDLLGVLRDLVVVRVAPDARNLVALPDADREELARIAESAPSADDLTRLHLVFSKAAEEILDSPLPRASLEMALVRVAKRPPLLALDDLLRRLGELEGRLEAARGGAKREAGARPRAKASPAADPEPPAPQLPAPAPARAPPPSPPPQAPAAFAPPAFAPAPPPAPAAPSAAAAPAPFSGPAPAPAFTFAVPASVMARAEAAAAALDSDDEPPPPSDPGFSFAAFDDYDAGPPPSQPPPSARAPRPNPGSSGSSGSHRAPAARPDGRTPILDEASPQILEYARFVDFVRGRSSRVSSLLERVPLVAFGENRIVLWVDPASFEGGLLFDAESRALIEEAAVAKLGPHATVELVEAPSFPGAPTLAALATKSTRLRNRELDDKVRNHPLVTALVTSLPAEIRDVRVVSEADVATLAEMLERAR
jgi:DNA polymerase III subunit gamma/tau